MSWTERLIARQRSGESDAVLTEGVGCMKTLLFGWFALMALICIIGLLYTFFTG